MMYRILFLSFIITSLNAGFAQAIKTEVVPIAGGFQLLRGGQPYFIRGAGGFDFPERIATYGGNSTRTWGTDANTINLLNEAHSSGLTVLMGLWVGHENHGFDYNNETAVQQQLDAFRELVLMYKDHPAVLGWGIGNEVELGVLNYNLKVWDAINDISEMIHEVDGNHITLTVTAGIDVNKANAIKQRAPDLDMLGVNAYGGIGGVPGTLQSASWNKPYIITEWGPNGQWEVAKTSWGTPLEQTSTEKAIVYKQRYESVIVANPNKCLGSYVFLWSNKFEETPTWYGLFLPTGDEVGAVDAMHHNWTGTWPTNRVPEISSGTIEGKTAGQSILITRDAGNVATIQATDPEGDELTYEFLILPAIGYSGTVTDASHTFPYLPNLITSQTGNSIVFKAPANFNNYRLYIISRDTEGNAAVMNIPFRVELGPLVSEDPAILFTTGDAYVRDGEYQTIAYGTTDKERLVTRKSAMPDNGSNREAFITFDLTSLTQGFDEVLLEVYGSTSETVSVGVQGSQEFIWNENTINWSNAIANDLQSIDTITLNSSFSGYASWNVTSYLKRTVNQGKTAVTFVLKNVTETGGTVSWNSKELRNNPPRLKFAFNGGDLITSLPELVQGEYCSVYPNPVLDFLRVDLNSPGMINLVDSWGRTLTTISASGETQLDLRSMASGIYLLVIEQNNVRKQFRILKK